MELWPGFEVRLNRKEAGIVLTIDPTHKLIRYETALQKLTYIMDLSDSKGLDFQVEATKEFEGITVVTSYNNKVYKVSRLDFEKTPNDKFFMASSN